MAVTISWGNYQNLAEFRQQFQIGTVFGAEDSEIAVIEGAYLPDVQPFGQRHNCCICVIQLSVRVLPHDFSHARHVFSDQGLNHKSAILNIFKDSQAVEKVGN